MKQGARRKAHGPYVNLRPVKVPLLLLIAEEHLQTSYGCYNRLLCSAYGVSRVLPYHRA